VPTYCNNYNYSEGEITFISTKLQLNTAESATYCEFRLLTKYLIQALRKLAVTQALF